MNSFDKKLQYCAQLCYRSEDSKLPRYKMNQNVTQIISSHSKVELNQINFAVENTTPKKIEIKGYKILSKLGQGGMGVVYKALQLSMQRIVAIKVLPNKNQKKEKIKRFLREAKSVAKLNHKHIVSGIDAGTTDTFYYFVMEYVEGKNVGQILKDGPLSWKYAVDVTIAVTEGLYYANKVHGVIHRDVKPDNILISKEGNIKLCDLGLARTTDDIITNDGNIMGTPHYMSPEQCRGKIDITKSSDIYSLGITLFHMLLGKVPFDAPHPAAICLKHTNSPLPSLKKYNKDLPEVLCFLVQKMTHKKLDNRLGSYEHLLKLLNKAKQKSNRVKISKSTKTMTRQNLHRTSRIKAKNKKIKPSRKNSRVIIFSYVLFIILFIGIAYGILTKESFKEEHTFTKEKLKKELIPSKETPKNQHVFLNTKNTDIPSKHTMAKKSTDMQEIMNFVNSTNVPEEVINLHQQYQKDKVMYSLEMQQDVNQVFDTKMEIFSQSSFNKNDLKNPGLVINNYLNLLQLYREVRTTLKPNNPIHKKLPLRFCQIRDAIHQKMMHREFNAAYSKDTMDNILSLTKKTYKEIQYIQNREWLLDWKDRLSKSFDYLTKWHKKNCGNKNFDNVNYVFFSSEIKKIIELSAKACEK